MEKSYEGNILEVDRNKWLIFMFLGFKMREFVWNGKEDEDNNNGIRENYIFENRGRKKVKIVYCFVIIIVIYVYCLLFVFN